MDTSFPILCFNASGSLLSCAQNKLWAKLISTFQCFSAQKAIESCNNLSKKESVAFWANLPQYFAKIKEGEEEKDAIFEIHS